MRVGGRTEHEEAGALPRMRSLLVVRDGSWSDESAEALRKTVREVFGPDMRCDIEPVPAIEPTARGKYQFSICEIEP